MLRDSKTDIKGPFYSQKLVGLRKGLREQKILSGKYKKGANLQHASQAPRYFRTLALNLARPTYVCLPLFSQWVRPLWFFGGAPSQRMVGQRERSPSLGEKIEAAGWPDRRGSEGGAPVMPDLLVTTPFSKEPPDGCDDARDADPGPFSPPHELAPPVRRPLARPKALSPSESLSSGSMTAAAAAGAPAHVRTI